MESSVIFPPPQWKHWEILLMSMYVILFCCKWTLTKKLTFGIIEFLNSVVIVLNCDISFG